VDHMLHRYSSRHNTKLGTQTRHFSSSVIRAPHRENTHLEYSYQAQIDFPLGISFQQELDACMLRDAPILLCFLLQYMENEGRRPSLLKSGLPTDMNKHFSKVHNVEKNSFNINRSNTFLQSTNATTFYNGLALMQARAESDLPSCKAIYSFVSVSSLS